LATFGATKEVIISAGALGSPHLLMLSGIGPCSELEALGITCIHDSPYVGKNLLDHVMVPEVFGVNQKLGLSQADAVTLCNC